ncbi:MAG: NifB/NifX family molybdenum-iron cluster-binding protein [Candidatus Limnocylindrales bacterium]
MIICVPVDSVGQIDPRWGRAARVALGDVRDGRLARWHEFDVGWDQLHDVGPEGGHHARVARFLREHRVEIVLAHHMGDPMQLMLQQMGLDVRLGVAGDARLAVITEGSRAAGVLTNPARKPPLPM